MFSSTASEWDLVNFFTALKLSALHSKIIRAHPSSSLLHCWTIVESRVELYKSSTNGLSFGLSTILIMHPCSLSLIACLLCSLGEDFDVTMLKKPWPVSYRRNPKVLIREVLTVSRNTCLCFGDRRFFVGRFLRRRADLESPSECHGYHPTQK